MVRLAIPATAAWRGGVPGMVISWAKSLQADDVRSAGGGFEHVFKGIVVVKCVVKWVVKCGDNHIEWDYHVFKLLAIYFSYCC